MNHNQMTAFDMDETLFCLLRAWPQIRRAEAGDLPAVAAIYEQIIANESAGTVYTGWQAGVYPTLSTAEAAFARKELFVALDQGQVAAGAILNHSQNELYAGGNWEVQADPSQVMVLHTLAVSPGAAGRGIGTSLVRFYEALARLSGCKALRMDTNATNTPARALYRRLGYREAGISAGVFNGIAGVELVLLEKGLL